MESVQQNEGIEQGNESLEAHFPHFASAFCPCSAKGLCVYEYYRPSQVLRLSSYPGIHEDKNATCLISRQCCVDTHELAFY